MPHHHLHPSFCTHVEVKFCPCCLLVYCTSCHKEWSDKPAFLNWNGYPSWGQWTYTSTGEVECLPTPFNGTITTSTPSCSHKVPK